MTYAFPPVAYVGVYRSLKYCKYLSGHRWHPVVLTARPHRTAHQDPSLALQIPDDVAVHRTADIDPAKWRLPWKRPRERPDPAAPGTGAGNSPSPGRPSALARVKQFVFRAVMASPDSHWWWVPFGVLRGLLIVLRTRIDVVYCSSPPHSSLLIAYLVGKLCRKPYVIDFRDPWLVLGSLQPPVNKVAILLRLETLLKRRIVRDADRVICVSPGELEELRAEFPTTDRSRFVCITNGYDPSDAPADATAPPRRKTLTLLHAGTIYAGTAGEFFEALRDLSRHHPAIAAQIRVDLIGELADEYLDIVRQLETSNIVRRHGLVPHQTALQMMRASDVSVVLLGGDTFPASEIPAKTFEYLHAGRTILAVTAEGDLADTVRGSGLGVVVPPLSPAGVAQILRQFVAECAAGTLQRTPNLDFIRRFERTALTAQLAEVLEKASESGRARVPASRPWTYPASQ